MSTPSTPTPDDPPKAIKILPRMSVAKTTTQLLTLSSNPANRPQDAPLTRRVPLIGASARIG